MGESKMIINEEQLSAIEYALCLAEYFCEDQEQGRAQAISDWDTVNNAIKAIKEIKKTSSDYKEIDLTQWEVELDVYNYSQRGQS
jgi:hypothetical protein